MSQYSKFFLNSKSSIVLVECVELSHPGFSTTHRVVRNVTAGVTVTHEDDLVFEYTYYPLTIRQKGSLEDLDFGIEIEFGDLDGLLQDEIATLTDYGLDEKPICNFRQYRSDNYSMPIYGPLVLEITELSFTKEGAQFEAVAPYRNVSSTGELYTLNKFPMLRGLL